MGKLIKRIRHGVYLLGEANPLHSGRGEHRYFTPTELKYKFKTSHKDAIKSDFDKMKKDIDAALLKINVR